jgi:hypothetical protein
MPDFRIDTAAYRDGTLVFARHAWLEYRAAGVEHDFIRFRQQARAGFVALFLALFLLYFVIAALTLDQDGAGASLRIVYSIIGIGISVVAIAALVALVFCAANGTVAEQLVVAQRLEVLTVLPVTVEGMVLCLLVPLAAASVCAGHGDRCHYYAYNIVTVNLITATVVYRIRVKWFVPAAMGYIAAFLAGSGAAALYEAIDYVVALVMLLAFMAAVTAEAVASERNQRQHFEDYVALLVAQEATELAAEVTEEILNAAMPPELRRAVDQVGTVAHSSSAAALGMCDIYDFAQWSCGHLVLDVVDALHCLLTCVDVGCETFDVVPAMTYGDCCVVCANLILPVEDGAERVAALCRHLVERVGERGMQLRAVAVVGGLRGSVAGTEVKRYVVWGPAMAKAEALLQTMLHPQFLGVYHCEGEQGGVAVAVRHKSPASRYTASRGLDARSDATPERPHQPSADTARQVAPSANSGETADERDAYSAVLLRFAAAETRRLHEAYLAKQDAAAAHLMALIPLAVFGGFVVVVLLERASPDPRRHHDDAVPLAMLAVSVLVFAAIFVLRWHASPLHFGATYAATAVTLLVALASLHMLDCVFASPRISMMSLLALPPLFARLPWMLQWLVQLVCVVLPVLAFTLNQQAHGVGDSIFAVLVFCVVRYVTARGACVQFVTAQHAAAHAAAAVAHSERNEELVLGLIPLHAVPHRPRAVVDRPGGFAAPTYVAQWQSVSVVAVAVTGVPQSGAGAWNDIAAAVHAAIGDDMLLETVLSAGDRFSLAGPFQPRVGGAELDTMLQRTAWVVVELLRSLADVIAGAGGSFTAVATAGYACGSLVGASLLTFRLFGPAVRECDALLAAAPTAPFGVAFAADSFRQQHNNHGVPQLALTDGAAMSQAVVARGDTASAATAAATLASHASHDEQSFGERVRWRVRGVGVVAVSIVDLQRGKECANTVSSANVEASAQV